MNFAFLHGGGQGSWVWQETIAALRTQAAGPAECLALDVPGCGTKRSRDTSAVAFDDIARELNDDIAGSGMRDVVLVGHSQAGTVLPRMAEFAPQLFSRLIYVTCSAPRPGTNTMEQMGDGLHGEHEDQVGWPVDPKTSSVAERFPVMFGNDMTPGQKDAFFAKLGNDAWPECSYSYSDWRYDHLSAVPASFVHCMRDMSLPPAWQRRFAEVLRVGRTVHIDAGHQVMNTRPHGLAEVLLAEAAG